MGRLTTESDEIRLNNLKIQDLMDRHKKEVAAYLELLRLMELIEDYPQNKKQHVTSWQSLHSKLLYKSNQAKKLDSLITNKLSKL